MQTIVEIEYTLPGAAGGRRVDPITYCDDTPEQDAASQAALDHAVAVARRGGARNVKFCDARRVTCTTTLSISDEEEDDAAKMHTVMTTNDGYDSILLVDANDVVVGAWSSVSDDDVRAYVRDGHVADNWAVTHPAHTAIADYGVECGRDGEITDESRARFWGVTD
ncbi:MAG: hypothetical protein KGL39_29385 [Patescibacteria group bacterium]|nr:hypothetical protein [Patescibacteria group bacterium]